MSELRTSLVKVAAEGRLADIAFRKKFPTMWNVLPRPKIVADSVEYKNFVNACDKVVEVFSKKEAQEEVRKNGSIGVNECLRYMQLNNMLNA